MANVTGITRTDTPWTIPARPRPRRRWRFQLPLTTAPRGRVLTDHEVANIERVITRAVYATLTEDFS